MIKLKFMSWGTHLVWLIVAMLGMPSASAGLIMRIDAENNLFYIEGSDTGTAPLLRFEYKLDTALSGRTTITDTPMDLFEEFDTSPIVSGRIWMRENPYNYVQLELEGPPFINSLTGKGSSVTVSYAGLSDADQTLFESMIGKSMSLVTGSGYSPISVQLAPAIPDAPIITGITAGDKQLTVAFTPGADNGSAITNYQYSLDGADFILFDPAITTSPAVISGLTNGTPYAVRLLAVNAIGNGTASNSVSGTPAALPDAPTITGITAGDEQLTVAFTPGADNGSAITNYQYSLDGGSYISFNPAITSGPVIIGELNNGTTYAVQVRAVNNIGPGADSNSVSGMPVAIPDAPTITGITAGDKQLTVAFTPGADNGSAITNYQYSLDGADFILFDPAITTSPVVISGLTNRTPYAVRLLAVNAIGNGTASNSVSATPDRIVTKPIPAFTSGGLLAGAVLLLLLGMWRLRQQIL